MNTLHGGDWAGYRERFGAEPLDFSASVSPLGLPEGVRRAVVAALSQSNRYPDPSCRTLRALLAQQTGLDPAQILCGNGVSDLLYRLALALQPESALLPAPSFSEYEAALSLTHCEIIYHPLLREEGFRLTEGILSAIHPGVSMVILCQPNNPTGLTVSPELLIRILQRCRVCAALLVVDESFLPFLECPGLFTLQEHLRDNKNLMLLRSFTKSHAMAGLRLGYALCSDTELLHRMYLAGAPWSVSCVAQAAGEAALGEEAYLAELRSLICRERPVLCSELEGLGCSVLPGEANYLFFSSPMTNLSRLLAQRGILIRDCSNFRGLSPGDYRIAVRTQEENRRLMSEMRSIIYG